MTWHPVLDPKDSLMVVAKKVLRIGGTQEDERNKDDHGDRQRHKDAQWTTLYSPMDTDLGHY